MRAKATKLVIGAAVLFGGELVSAATESGAHQPAPIPPAPPTNAKTIEALQGAYTSATRMSEFAAASAKKADEAGYAGVASLFRAMGKSESTHASMYAAQLTALKATASAKSEVKAPEVKSTKENIASALKALNTAREAELPAARKAAEGEGNRDAARAIRDAREGVIELARALKDAEATIEQWKAKRDYYVGRTCGFVVEKLDLTKCPVCAKGRDDFEKIN